MDGFKDSTKVQYFKGGEAGTKGAAKVAQTMSAFKNGSEGISTRPVDVKGRRMPMKMAPVKEAPRPAKGIGAIDAAMMASKVARKGVPVHSSKPVIERAKGGLAAMPKGGKC